MLAYGYGPGGKNLRETVEGRGQCGAGCGQELASRLSEVLRCGMGVLLISPVMMQRTAVGDDGRFLQPG